MIVTTTNATTMCVTDDMEQVILDPSVPGTDISNPTTDTWSVTFPYGIISGVATCNDTSAARAVPQPQYNDIFNTGTSGTLCWCRMLLPVRSTWVLFYTFDSVSECAADCTGYCAALLRDYASFRTAFFNGAGN